jgi:hypothetical protein
MLSNSTFVQLDLNDGRSQDQMISGTIRMNYPVPVINDPKPALPIDGLSELLRNPQEFVVVGDNIVSKMDRTVVIFEYNQKRPANEKQPSVVNDKDQVESRTVQAFAGANIVIVSAFPFSKKYYHSDDDLEFDDQIVNVKSLVQVTDTAPDEAIDLSSDEIADKPASAKILRGVNTDKSADKAIAHFNLSNNVSLLEYYIYCIVRSPEQLPAAMNKMNSGMQAVDGTEQKVKFKIGSSADLRVIYQVDVRTSHTQRNESSETSVARASASTHEIASTRIVEDGCVKASGYWNNGVFVITTIVIAPWGDPVLP